MNLIKEFIYELQNDNTLNGDVIEFGTGTGVSTLQLSTGLSNKKIFTFDGFKGLPKTEKVIPKGTGWEIGVYKYDKNEIQQKFINNNNIYSFQCWSWELKHPSEYGINTISGVNLDFDLYEGTMDGLHFIDKCFWKSLLLRFDDWGSHPHQIKEEVAEHEEAAFFDFIKETNYKYNFYDEYNKSSNNMQTIIKIKR
jgi:hypothetical protein